MTLLINNIRSDDRLQLAQAEAFLLDNPDPGVRIRPADQLARAIGTGQGLLVHDRHTICGISLVYQFDPGGEWPVAYEIGTMRVTTPGHRLQVFLAQLHLFQIYLEDDATRGDIFAVVTPGTPSEHNLTVHVGMHPYQPPDVVELLRREAGVPFKREKAILGADTEVIGRAFASLGALHLNGRLFRAPKGDAVIEIGMGWFRPELLDQGPSGGAGCQR